MFCEKCKIDRSDKDFVNNKKLCFRCEYQEKLRKAPQMQDVRRPLFCRMCTKQIAHDESLKKRQRTVFCSLECAQKGQKELNNNYWTRKLSIARVPYFSSD
jgi:hypothetical protein